MIVAIARGVIFGLIFYFVHKFEIFRVSLTGITRVLDIRARITGG